MLGKLLKYDFRALNRVMIPLNCAALIICILGIVLFNSLTGVVENNLSSRVYTSVSAISDAKLFAGGTAIFPFFLLVIAAAFHGMVFVLLRQHNRKAFIGDEGQLAFLLPVTPSQLLISKVIVTAVWLFINMLILAAFLLALVFCSPAMQYLLGEDVYSLLYGVIESLSPVLGGLFVVEIIVLNMLSGIGTALQITTAAILEESIPGKRTLMENAPYMTTSAASLLVFPVVLALSAYGLFVSDWLHSQSPVELLASIVQPILIVSLILNLALVIITFFGSKAILTRRFAGV